MKKQYDTIKYETTPLERVSKGLLHKAHNKSEGRLIYEDEVSLRKSDIKRLKREIRHARLQIKQAKLTYRMTK